MNSLLNYGSDDDYDDSSEEKQTDWRGTLLKDKGSQGSQIDTNYEEVQMELSEGSNDSKADNRSPPRRRSRDRDSRDRRTDRDSRESRERERDRGRYEKEREKSSREKLTSRDFNYSRRDRERGERDRKSRRSNSRDKERERRRSRSPKREPRSRSRSRERARKYSRKNDRDRGSKSREEKTDLPKNVDIEKGNTSSDNNRFFMPGITGRFRDQIERRKQLWQKKDTEIDDKNGQSKKVWETTTFAQDTDGKVANKFKRLMGIKNTSEASGQGVDVLRKQEEMFSSMEQQYEVARTATHTMRGVGLGFGSYQR